MSRNVQTCVEAVSGSENSRLFKSWSMKVGEPIFGVKFTIESNSFSITNLTRKSKAGAETFSESKLQLSILKSKSQ